MPEHPPLSATRQSRVRVSLAVKRAHEANGAGIAVRDAHRGHTWDDLVVRSEALERQLADLGSPRFAVLHLPQTFDAIATLVACERAGMSLVLVSTLYSAAHAEKLMARAGADCVLGFDGDHLVRTAIGPAQRQAPADQVVFLTTSGTTGEPKLIEHTWPSLAGAVHDNARHTSKRWLLAYPLSHFAALQVLLQSLLTSGTLVLPVSLSPSSVFDAIVDHGVERLSCTPTFARQLLLANGTDRWQRAKLEAITLGGEIADQHTLDALRAVAPETTLRHIYASTELGAVLTVSDGKEGFGREHLDGRTLKVEDGQLFVRRRADRSMTRYLDQAAPELDTWFATGDLVSITEDRVHFAGRIDDVINVGGLKVNPVDVERVVRSVAGVDDVLVVAHPSSIAGNLVKALVVARGSEPQATRGAILARCRETLPAHMVPRIIEMRDRIEVEVSQKRSRVARAD
jgi:acyl-CoA synthetase (AMP-forming)/AMP-acid ligase II